MNKQIQSTQPSMPEFEEYIEEIRTLWESRILTNMGVKHRTLETMLANFLESPNICLYTNGHLALEATIEAMDLKGEVITTPFTFASTTHAIVRKGLKPVFCDICADDFSLDSSKLEALITEQTSAILPVHVFGKICDVAGIGKIAKKYHLKVIYDAAHAFGVKVNGVGVAKFGDASIFSFHSTKVFNTVEGGAVAFADTKLKRLLDGLKNFGITGPESIEYIGGNAKMNELQAAMGICNLRHFEEQIMKRQKIMMAYREGLNCVPGIGVLPEQPGVQSNYSYCSILVDEKLCGKTRGDIAAQLSKENIKTKKYFYPLTSDFSCYKNTFDSELTPVARDITERVLCLPIYAELEESDVDRICKIVISI